MVMLKEYVISLASFTRGLTCLKWPRIKDYLNKWRSFAEFINEDFSNAVENDWHHTLAIRKQMMDQRSS